VERGQIFFPLGLHGIA